MLTKKEKAALSLNVIIIVLEIAGFAMCFFAAKDEWYTRFVYYTQCSNFFALIVSVIYVISFVRCKKHGLLMPQWVKNIRFLATSCLAVTFVIVIIVLGPMAAVAYEPIYYFGILLWKDAFVFHFSAPLLSIVSTIFLEGNTCLSGKMMFIGTIPTIAYAIISTTINVLKIGVGPYPFLHVYEQPVWMSVMWFILIPFVAYIITRIIWFANKKVFRE